MLGLTVNACSASVRDASGRNAYIFCGEVNSNPEVFFFVLTQNGEVCSVDVSDALKSGILCKSCTWLAGCMMKSRGQCTGTAPFSIRVSDWCIVAVCLWSYTFHLRKQQQQKQLLNNNYNDNNNNTPPGACRRVVSEELSTRQDSHQTGKPGASQGSPLRVAPVSLQWQRDESNDG